MSLFCSCGGCERCMPFDYDNRANEEDAFTGNARQALVAAANDLVKQGNISDTELRALEELLEVFDPQEEVAEEADGMF